MIKCATMTIKKKFFDQIRDKAKTKEYRRDSPYYQKMFERVPEYLKFHYQGNETLFVECLSVKKIQTPERLKMIDTQFCYEISLGKSQVL